ncbi:MAG: 3-hydroxyacyl-CoA dehydrogenase NAD-binding domain-containing protein [Pseudomonadota bacterium]
MKNPNIAILGAGTIGMSWAALFAATGRNVSVFDPSPDTRERVIAMVHSASETLSALGHEHAGDASRMHFTDDPGEAVKGADFIQESVPERLDIKHALYARIEPHLKERAIIGSSTSGLKLSDMQEGLARSGRLVLAHPFNPPHLIPLVELMENDKTDEGVLGQAKSFYENLGKVCICLNKEVPGHVANRLQAALWREAIHLAAEGVASVEDIDKAVAFGPGLRWAALGPSALFHLGGGEAGIRGFCEHLGGPMQSWWDDLGAPRITPEIINTLETGLTSEAGDVSAAELARRRDRLVLLFTLAAMEKTPTSSENPE